MPRLRPTLLVVALLTPLLSFAQGAPDAARDRGDPGGELKTQLEDGKVVPLPLKHTKVSAEVSGFVSRVEVVQTFHNPFEQRIEAVYVFPLPDNGAVDGMVMQVGRRTIRGEIKRREEARALYEAAKTQGRTAALLDQERPNIFTQQVANILPGEEVQVTLTYVAPLQYDDGRYTFNFPMVVGPRYMPLDGSVKDAQKLSPPLLPEGTRSGHDISLTLKLDAGMPLRKLVSPSHDVEITRKGMREATVTLEPHDTVPNKDFILRYDVAGERLQAGILTHRDERGGFFTLMLQPQADFRSEEVTPKEMFFVIDQSCSQSGLPMEKQKGIIHEALSKLHPRDTFNVITFHSGVQFFSPRSLPNTPANVAKAKAFVDALQANGGTEMLHGVNQALGQPQDKDRLRMLLFLSDGYVGNDNQIIDAVQKQVGSARMFTYGVGSSVNHFLLQRMAEVGRGYYQYSPPTEDTRASVEKFYERIAKPYLVDLSLDFGDLGVTEVYPRTLRDLYAAQPLIVTGRFEGGGTGKFTLKGRIANRPYEERIEVSLPTAVQAENAALASMFGRAKVEHLMSQLYGGEKPELVEAVTKTALQHRLMSKYTSFVAVDEVARAGEGAPATVVQPLPIPEGTQHQAFGATGAGAPVATGVGGAPPPALLMMRRSAPMQFDDSSVEGALMKPDGAPGPSKRKTRDVSPAEPKPVAEEKQQVRALSARVEGVVVKGPLTKAEVERAVTNVLTKLHAQLRAEGYRGKVTLKLLVGADGQVTQVVLVHAGTGSGKSVKRLQDGLRAQRLPAKSGPSEVVVQLDLR